MILLNYFYEIASLRMLLATTQLARLCLFLSLRAKRGNLVFGKD
jgi:hypothetical protein